MPLVARTRRFLLGVCRYGFSHGAGPLRSSHPVHRGLGGKPPVPSLSDRGRGLGEAGLGWFNGLKQGVEVGPGAIGIGCQDEVAGVIPEGHHEKSVKPPIRGVLPS